MSGKENLDVEQLKTENQRLKENLKLFESLYFKDLDYQTIAELAKKSIRLTAENRRLEDIIEELSHLSEMTGDIDIGNKYINTCTYEGRIEYCEYIATQALQEGH